MLGCAGASAVCASIYGREWAADVASADDVACEPADDHRTVVATAHHHPAADSAVGHGLGPTATRRQLSTHTGTLLLLILAHGTSSSG